MRVEIIEVDRDYNSVSSSVIKTFNSLQEAEGYCKRNSWTGFYYMVGWYESK